MIIVKKTLKKLKKEIVDNDEIINIVNVTVEKDETFKDLKKDYPNEIEKIEEASTNYEGEDDLKIPKK